MGELRDGQVIEYEIHPEDFGLQMVSNRSLKVADAQESKTMLLGALNNKPGVAREIVTLNAGHRAFMRRTWWHRLQTACTSRRKSSRGGPGPAEKVDELVKFTQQFAS